MERAKEAAHNFLSHDGKHKTTVDEDVSKAVKDEHVYPHRHEKVTTAVDKEVHQHHHHTVVQPVTVKETLPEKHTHNVMPVEEKVYHHGNDKVTRDTLDKEAAKYMDTSLTHEATHTQSMVHTMTGERVYHHVHEHVQPIIQKEIHAPHVIHTVMPVHEVHHVKTQHHGTSILPAKTLEDFIADGGVIDGRASSKIKELDRDPEPYNKDLQEEQLEGDKNMHDHGNHNHHAGFTAVRTYVGPGNPAIPAKSEKRMETGVNGVRSIVDNKPDKSNTHDIDSNNGYSVNSGRKASGTAADHTSSTPRSTKIAKVDSIDSDGAETSTLTKKPSLLNRINPLTDADGDGKKGFMH